MKIRTLAIGLVSILLAAFTFAQLPKPGGGGSGGGGDASTNTATSVDSEIALFSGTDGKTLKRATTTGILKGSSGVLSAATAGTDYLTPFDAATELYIIDDLFGLSECSNNAVAIGTYGESNWSVAGGTATCTRTGAGIAANHPSVVLFSTGTTTNNVVAYRQRFFVPADSFDASVLVRLNTNDSNTYMIIGLVANSTAFPPTDGIYVEKTGSDTSWFGVTRASSSQTRTSALVATSTNWIAFRIRRVDASTIGFRTAATLGGLSAASETTLTATIPTADIGLAVSIKTLTGASKSFDLDLVSNRITGMSR